MIEAIAAIFSLWCVWLAVKNNKWTWPIGIIGVGAYIIVFWLAKLYADFGLQIIFMAQGFYGWWYWIGGRKKIEPPISKMSNWDIFVITPIALGVSTWALGILLHKYTDAALPYFDALASTTSLVANWLLAKRKLENWYLWIPVNLLYIGIFIYKEMPISAVLYVIFFVLAIKGFYDWRKEYREQFIIFSQKNRYKPTTLVKLSSYDIEESVEQVKKSDFVFSIRKVF